MRLQTTPSGATKGELTRERLIDAARTLFASQGYHATTTRQITDRAALTPGAMYNHFRGKDDIFEAVLERYHPWLQIPPVVAMASGNSIEEFARDAAERLAQIWEARPEDVRLHLIELIEFQGQHLPLLFEATFQRMTANLEGVLRGHPEFRSVGTPALSRALLGLFFAYLMSDRFTGGALVARPEPGAFDYFADAYLKGVLSADVETRGSAGKPPTDARRD